MKEMSGENLFGSPPRPPCWQDFCSSKKPKGKTTGEYQLKCVLKSCQAPPLPSKNNKTENKRNSKKTAGVGSPKVVSKSNVKLRRTRSEPNICDNDFPAVCEEGVTINLSDVVLPLYPSPVVDLKENYQRCQKWLANVEPCCPIEDPRGLAAPKGSEGRQSSIRDELKRGTKQLFGGNKKSPVSGTRGVPRSENIQPDGGFMYRWNWGRKGKKLWKKSSGST